jgi:DNA-directed RNA polymerase subunit K/omega
MAVAQDTSAHAQHHRAMSAHQHLKRTLIALREIAFQQLPIRIFRALPARQEAA